MRAAGRGAARRSPATGVPGRWWRVLTLVPLPWVPIVALTAAEPPQGSDRPPFTVRDRPGARSLGDRTTLDDSPSAATLAKARAEYRRRHGGSREGVGTSAAAQRKAEDLMNEAAAERSPAMRWVLLDEARKMGIASGSAFLVDRAVRLLGSEFDVDELDLEYRSLREIPIRALRGERIADLARSAEKLATGAEADGRTGLAIDSLALAVRAWQALGAGRAARSAAERHDHLVAKARDDAKASRANRAGPGRSPNDPERRSGTDADDAARGRGIR